MGWSNYADFTTEDTLKFAPAENVERAVWLAWDERKYVRKNQEPCIKLAQGTTGKLVYLYDEIKRLINYDTPFYNPVTFEKLDWTGAMEAWMGEPMLPRPSEQKLLRLDSIKYWHFFYRFLNKLRYMVHSDNPLMGTPVDFKYYKTARFFSYSDYGGSADAAFDAMVAHIASDPLGSVQSGFTQQLGHLQASCTTTNNNVWTCTIEHQHGTLNFERPVKILWKTDPGNNSTWVNLNLTNVPVEWTEIGSGTTVAIPRWNIVSCPAERWASYGGTSNTFLQRINSKIIEDWGADENGFEFIQGS
jgi:hypothetical protein